LRYLSRYTHRVAISNRRLISANENGVTVVRSVLPASENLHKSSH
jgi:hypothetical protein